MSDGKIERRERAASGVRRTAAAGAVLLALFALLPAPPASAVQSTFELRPAQPVTAVPPLPPTSEFPVQLVLDDDTEEGAFGLAGANGARQFLWFNRFANPGPFRLAEIWVLFPGGANMSVGAAVELAVYLDPDGDPSNGAQLLATYDETIQAVDDQTFSIYPVDPPLSINDPGDVLIGVVNRFVESGVTPPTSPAALDLTASAGRSWFAVWTGDPPAPPQLPGDVLTTRIDDFDPQAAGNWMIRGFGIEPNAVEIPTLSAAGLAALALFVALVAAAVLRRRRTVE